MIQEKEDISEYPSVSKQTQRRLTGATVSSRSTDFTESCEEMSSDESSENYQGDGLAKNIIKQEMVQSLTRVAAARYRKTNGDSSDMKDAEVAIRKLATMVLDGDENGDDSSPPKIDECKPDQKLRELLRQALVVGNDEDDWPTDPASTAAAADGDAPHHDMKDAPLDIWHSDFWGTGDGSLNDSSNISTTIHTGSSTCASRSSGQRTEGEDSSAGNSLQEFLANLKEISSDSDESDDDISVLSDITGLTECFPDDDERKTAAKEERSKVLLETSPSIKSIPTRSSTSRNKVAFGEVRVRKYERILCDNPACTSGPSIGVGWRYKAQAALSVDAYEGRRGPLRGSKDLMLDRAAREKIIRRIGCSEKEIAEMTRSVNRTKFHRRQTLNNLGVEKMELAVETAKRRLKSFLFIKGKDVKTKY